MSTKRTISDLGDENLRPCKRGAPAICTTTDQRPRTPLLPLAAIAPIPAAHQRQPQQAACRAAGVPKSDEADGASPGAAKPARRLPGRLAQPAAPPAELPALSLAECRVIYVATAVEVDWWANRFLRDPRLAAVALDIEWRVTFKTGETPRPAALVQLAYRRAAPPAGEPPYTCVLLHVAVAGLTPALRALLQSPRPAKVGVGIHGDALKMQRDWGLEAQGIVDLSEMALERGVFRGGDPGAKWSLADLAERVLKRRLAKLPALRLSDWEAAPLSQPQASYAALDAFACLRIYEALQQLPILQMVLDARTAAAAAAAAAQALGADAFAAPAAAADVGGFVPALPVPQRLQPAKQAVCSAFHEQGMSIAAIAELKRIQPSTVSSYLAEAVLGGHAYSWRRFGVPDAALAAVEEAAAAVLLPAPCAPAAGTGTLTAAAFAAATAASAPVAAAALPALAASAAPQDSAAVWATGVFADASEDSEDEALLTAMLAQPAACTAQHNSAAMPGSGTAQQPMPLQPTTASAMAPCAAVSASAAAGPTAAAQAAAASRPGAASHAAQQVTPSAAPPVDLAAMLSAAGVGTRAFKERLAVDVDYGHIRLALAHLGRTSWRFAALAQQH